jgi:hypothetical protein
MQLSIFQRYSKLTMATLVVVVLLLCLILLEIFAKNLGLGAVVVYETNPIYGYRPKPNQTLKRNSHTIYINNLGLRAESIWEKNNPANKILFLGDSVTYGGSYISNSQLFSTLALTHFPLYIAGNAGVNGWGVNNVHALIKETAFLPAQVYISVFPEGDFYRGLQRIGGQPFWTKKPRFALEELFQYFIYKIQLKKMPIVEYYDRSDFEKEQIASIAVRNLKDYDDFLKAHHKIHLIYITPSCLQTLSLEKEDEILKNLFVKYGLKVDYIKRKINHLSPEEKHALFHDSIHLSVKGHQQWAQIIAADLQKVI